MDERGQTMAEYALVLGVITIGIVLAVGALSGVVVDLVDVAVGALS